MSKLGTFVSASQIEASVIDLLETWMHTYLGHAERTLGYPVYPAPGSIPRPKTYTTTAGNALSLPDRLLPRIVVQSSGWTGAPEHDGQFTIATWGLSVVGYWKGHDSADTQAVVRDVAAMVRVILTQKVPEIGDTVQVLDENYDAVPVEREHTLAGFEIVATITVSQVADRFAGVDAVDPEPQPTDEPLPPVDYGDWINVAETAVTVENVPPDEEVGS